MKKNTFRGLTRSIAQQLLMVLLLFAAIPLQMFGDEVRTYQGVSLRKPAYRGGAYQVGSREELLWWALNDQGESLSLTADINLQGGKQLLTDDGQTLKLSSNQVVVWPCVYYNSSCPTIDGNNHTISGLYQKNGYGVEGKLGSYEAYDWVGFISYSKPTITIKNLNIADSYFCGKVAGGFMGQKSKHATSTSTANLVNCSFRGLVDGEQYAGGFVGHYRTDGQDANIYRCINYGTVRVGNYFDNDIYAAAGGIVGYLDVTHAAFAKANTNFNRCVNYGSIRNFTPGANVGGIVGRVWDNNNGVREWRFCFNFGKVTKLDQNKKKLAGSGLIGNYIHVNDKSEPKILSCGNARKSDTGAVLDSLTWNDKSKAPVMSGLKVIKSEKLFSSIEQDKSWASWWTNNWGKVGLLGFSVVAALGLTAGAVLLAAFGAPILAVYAGIAAAGMYVGVGCTISDLLDSNSDMGPIYDSLRSSKDASKTMSDVVLPYGEDDVRTAFFAYDCNLMMQSDYVGGEKNDDKSILFAQHIDVNDATKNDELPSIIAANASQSANTLYYGYKGCNHMPRVSNENNLLSAPLPHTYAADGSCTVCGMKLEPLDVVTKQVDGKVVVDYYTIKNASQLRYLASVFNGEDVEGSTAAYKAYAGATFKLLNDITLDDYVIWSPIGSYNSYGTDKTSDKWHPFRGFFDGQGHTIRGLRTDDRVNYAGLFGDVYKGSIISNVKLSDCSFSGNIAGSIAGRLDTKGNMYYDSNENIAVYNSGADSSVAVTAVSANEKSCGGGLFGEVNPYVDNARRIIVTNCYSNATLQQRNQGYEANAQNILGAFAGTYNPEQYYKKYGISEKPTFTYCYFGGISSVADLNYVGTVKSNLNENRFVDCYMVGDQAEAFDKDNSSSRRVVRSYISGGRLAYDLMVKSLTNGKFLWGQEGSYPVLVDDTSRPTICKATINTLLNSELFNIGDTIINKRGPRLNEHFGYAGIVCYNKIVRGWANDNFTEEETERSGYGLIYDMPWYRYAIDIDMSNYIRDEDYFEVYNESLIKLVGMHWVYGIKVKIKSDLDLTGECEWTLRGLPEEIKGYSHTIRIAKPFIENRPRLTRIDTIHVSDLCIKGDTLSKDVLFNRDGKEVPRIYSNIITIPTNLNKTFLSYLDESKKDDLTSTTLENVVNLLPDSTAMSISNGKGNDVTEVTFSDAQNNNNYESILGYMLKHNMLDTFGLRLDGKNEKVAGKFGFAADANKRIYRVKLYSQATGAESGEVLMNSDCQYMFKVDGDKLGDMIEGIPAGCFAVLPMTKEELGDKFVRLATNIITKDGYANVIRLNDKETKGFAYPSCFPGSDSDASSITITANRAEYVRKVRRNGAHEGLYLPFAFTSLEFDEDELQGDDKMDIAFIDAVDGDGLSADGTKFELSSLSSYHAKKYKQETDPSDDKNDMLFIAGVPYFINIDCSERIYDRTEITFVGYNVGFLREPFALEACEPLYGTFKAITADKVAKDMNVYILGDYHYPGTGVMYEKFIQVYTYELEPFSCYLAINQVLQSIPLSIDGNDVTGINNVVKGSVEADGKTYDILGRRINAANAKGVYIKNGKKVINLK